MKKYVVEVKHTVTNTGTFLLTAPSKKQAEKVATAVFDRGTCVRISDEEMGEVKIDIILPAKWSESTKSKVISCQKKEET